MSNWFEWLFVFGSLGCLVGVFASIWESLAIGRKERALYYAHRRGVESALGGVAGLRVVVREGVRSPYRVEVEGLVWGFETEAVFVRFLNLYLTGLFDDVRECVRVCGGRSLMHPCFAI